MKKLILFIIFTVCLNSFSQDPKIEYENFKLQDDKKIKWQKIYNYNASKDSIVEFLDNFISEHSFLNNLKLNNFSFSGYSNYSSITNKKGLSYAVQKEFNCFVKIEVKPKRYRITISKVKFKPVEIEFSGITMNDPFSLEDLAVRDNHFELRKNKKARLTLKRLNQDFLNLLKVNSIKKDSW